MSVLQSYHSSRLGLQQYGRQATMLTCNVGFASQRSSSLICHAKKQRKTRIRQTEVPYNRTLINYIQHVFQKRSDVESIGLAPSMDGGATDSPISSYNATSRPRGDFALAPEPSTEEVVNQLARTIGLVAAMKYNRDAPALETQEQPCPASVIDEGHRQSSDVYGDMLPRGPKQSTGSGFGSSNGLPNDWLTPQDVDSPEMSGDEVTSSTTIPFCSVQHPGVLCCTSSTVTQDSRQNLCLITVKTLTRATKDSSVYTMSDLMALGSQALETSARELKKKNTQQLQTSNFPQDRIQNHKEIQHILANGKIVEAVRNPVSQFGHESYQLKLRDRRTGKVINSLFKPRVNGDSDGWHRVPVELIAYELGIMLGMDYVPPVAYRTGGVDVDFTRYDEGAFIYYAGNARPLKHYAHNTWHVRKDVMLSDTRILDVLLHNSDRHHGHFLMGEHWVDGQMVDGRWQGFLRPILIDHAAGFRPEALVTMEHENAFQTGRVRCVSARTYLRLRFLEIAEVRAKFGKYLTDPEVTQLMERRDAILRYLDRLVDEQGYDATVIENPLLA